MPSGRMPSSSCRRWVASRQTSQPSSNRPSKRSIHSSGAWCGRVRCARAVPEQERAVGVGPAELAEVGDGVVRQVGLQVVALLGRPRRLDVVGVAHQVGRPLVRLTVEEPVVPVEALTGRPHPVGAGVTLVAGHEVPLADAEGGVAVGPQDLGERPRGLREVARVPGKVRRQVGQHAHADAVMVAAGEQAGPGRRADRGGVEVREPEPPTGQPVDVRCLEVRAVATEMGEAEVVEDEHQDVRRPAPVRLRCGRPRGLGHRQRSCLLRHPVRPLPVHPNGVAAEGTTWAARAPATAGRREGDRPEATGSRL